MELVPCPETIDAAAGTVQLYESAVAIEAI